jgi:hypothetical protein
VEAAHNVDEVVLSGGQHERPTGRGDDGESRHASSPALKKKTVLLMRICAVLDGYLQHLVPVRSRFSGQAS